jgi:hypothetical protein
LEIGVAIAVVVQVVVVVVVQVVQVVAEEQLCSLTKASLPLRGRECVNP